MAAFFLLSIDRASVLSYSKNEAKQVGARGLMVFPCPVFKPSERVIQDRPRKWAVAENKIHGDMSMTPSTGYAALMQGLCAHLGIGDSPTLVREHYLEVDDHLIGLLPMGLDADEYLGLRIEMGQVEAGADGEPYRRILATNLDWARQGRREWLALHAESQQVWLCVDHALAALDVPLLVGMLESALARRAQDIEALRRPA